MTRAVAEEAAGEPRRRVVLLGASNLARGMTAALPLASRMWSGPVDIFGAFGHGRSYGKSSSVCFRQLPGIIQCGLWDHLHSCPPSPTAALITDIGNDLLYNAEVEQIADWINQCLLQLSQLDAKIVLTELPLHSVASLGRWQYRFFRTLFFPPCRIDLPEMVARVRALNARIIQIGRSRGATILKPKPEWYGVDPIHIRQRSYAAAWTHFFQHWNESPHSLDSPIHASYPGRSIPLWVYLRTRRPLERRWIGLTQRRLQPCCHLNNGSTLSLF